MAVRLFRCYVPLLVFSAWTTACSTGRLSGELQQSQRALDKAQLKVRGLEEQRREQTRQIEILRQQLKRFKMIQEVAQSVSRIRGLPLIHPLKVRQITDNGFIKRFLQAEFYRENTPQYIEEYTATLIKLGLFPKGMKLFQTMQDVLMEQWAGFYHPPQKTFFVRPGAPMLEMILAHEITHALQDQSYDLQTLIRSRQGNDDGTFAMQALVEGDALRTMATFTAQNISFRKVFSSLTDFLGIMTMDQRQLLAAPLYVREYMLRAYTDGMEFVQSLQREQGTQAIDKAFGAPPQTSEQILHPDKYLHGELPQLTSLPSLKALSPKWRMIHENTLGEIGISILLQSVGIWKAQAAASGWDGDRLRAYRNREGAILIAWLTRWDSEGDAREFSDTLTQYLDGRYKRGPGGWNSGGDIAAVQSNRTEVLLLDGALSCQQIGFIAKQLKLTPSARCS